MLFGKVTRLIRRGTPLLIELWYLYLFYPHTGWYFLTIWYLFIWSFTYDTHKQLLPTAKLNTFSIPLQSLYYGCLDGNLQRKNAYDTQKLSPLYPDHWYKTYTNSVVVICWVCWTSDLWWSTSENYGDMCQLDSIIFHRFCQGMNHTAFITVCTKMIKSFTMH